DEGAVFDDGLVLVHAVVVAGDGPAADVDLGADVGVAEIAEMIRLRAAAEARLFRLDEVADVHLVFQDRAGSDVRPRPHLRVVADAGFAGHAVGLEVHAIADGHVGEHAAGVDAAICPNLRRAAQLDTGPQFAVAADGDAGLDEQA